MFCATVKATNMRGKGEGRKRCSFRHFLIPFAVIARLLRHEKSTLLACDIESVFLYFSVFKLLLEKVCLAMINVPDESIFPLIEYSGK